MFNFLSRPKCHCILILVQSVNLINLKSNPMCSVLVLVILIDLVNIGYFEFLVFFSSFFLLIFMYRTLSHGTAVFKSYLFLLIFEEQVLSHMTDKC